MNRIIAFLIFASMGFLISPSLKADELDQMSFRELAQWVDAADSRALKGLAQRQFYFEVSENPEGQSDEYATMQDAIARRIPNEFSRPVFDVRFYFGDRSSINNANSIGILGGTGPLSDANITKQVMKSLDGSFRQGMVHLFSLPPPRTTLEKLGAGVLYTARLTKFVRHGYADYFLASNTAHLNIKSIEVLATPKKIVNLTELIADRVAIEQANDSSQEKVLILGTKAARDGKLYPGILTRKGIAFVDVSAHEQETLQQWIDRIKQKALNSDERVELEQFTENLALKYEAKEILLACTELPLGLGDEKAVLEGKGLKLYDTEHMISEIIAERFAALSSH